MSIIQFLRILWARRNAIVLSVLVCLGAAVLVGKILPARYTATSRVMLDIVKPDPVTGEIIAGQFARAYTATQIELIKDYRVAGRAAEIVGWTSSPQLFAQYQARSASDTRDFSHWVAQLIIDGTDAKLIQGSNILEISYTAPTPDAAAQVADAVREAYVDQAIALRRDDALTNAEWFDKQAAKIQSDLTAAEKRKNDFERANGIVLDDNMVDEASKRLSALAGAAQVSIPMVSGGNPMAAQLAQVDAQIAEASKVLGPNNPQLVAMKRQREALAASAASAGRTVGGGPSMTQLYNAQQAKVLADRGKADEARQLATNVLVLRDQYQKTLARAAALRQEGDSKDSGLTLLASASAPQSPSFPRWIIIIPGALGLGLTLGVLAALLTELTMRRVRGPEDLKALRIPLLGMMSVPPPVKKSRRRWFRRRTDAEWASA